MPYDGTLRGKHLSSLYLAKHGLDVYNGRSIDSFDGTNPQAVLLDLANGNGMKA